ncbi:MAG: ATP-binding protein [Thermodesulfobacteriota bacterium]
MKDPEGRQRSEDDGRLWRIAAWFLPVRPPSARQGALLWRDRVFFVLVLSGCAFGLPLFSSIKYSLFEGRWYNFWVFVGLYVWVLAITFVRAIPFTLRLITLLSLLYGLGVTSLVTVGPVGTGRVWLFAFSLSAAVLSGMRAGLFSVLLNAVTLILVGQMRVSGHFAWPVTTSGFAEIFSITNITFITLNTLTTLAIGVLLGGLEEVMDRERSFSLALSQSEERYRSILENIEEGFYELDLTGRFTFVNQAMCRIFACTKEELLVFSYKDYSDAETARKMFGIYHGVYETGTPAMERDLSVRRKDGKETVIELSASLIRDGRAKPVGFRGVVRDVSARVRSLREKEALEEKLRLSQKMEAVGTLAGGIAHDFNNILMGIQGNVSLMLLSLESDHPHYERLKTIEQHVKGASQLTRQLLGFARTGKYEVRALDLNELIQNTASMFSRTRREIMIEAVYDRSLPSVEADAGQMEQVLLNLLVNSWQAMPQGGRVFIETGVEVLSAEALSGRALAPGRYVKVRVTDTGVGMDEKTLKRVFDPFFTTKEMGRGTGLGLASVYGIMKNHGGFVTAESTPGKGASFTLYLPASEKQARSPETVPPAELQRGTEQVILVDDEEHVLATGKEMLKALGYRVVFAGDGTGAVEALWKNPRAADLVILDMIMPGMSGREVFDSIRRIAPNVRVLLSSGYSRDGEATEILESGCDGFIQKPFDLTDLSWKIRDVLDRNEAV